MFLESKQRQYTYIIILIIWLIISMHVWYRYVWYSSHEEETGKWWTFVEGTTQWFNYLPYVTNTDSDRFYQSFLFNGCLYPSVSWTNINYREELCTVETTDYKNFTITPKKWVSRSDGTSFTLNDLLFTYDIILKNNYWNISALDTYNNITVWVNQEENTLNVRFPKASSDNMIFFTNFIMPAHLLANLELEGYIKSFYQNPVGTNCARVQMNDEGIDTDNLVFDLSNCEDIPLKYYQIRSFDSQEDMDAYIAWQNNSIDLVIDDQSYDGYNQNKVVLNKFATLFFNTQRSHLYSEVRQALASLILHEIFNTSDIDEHIIQDQFLFWAIQPIDENTSQETVAENIKTLLTSKKNSPEKTSVFAELPASISFISWSNAAPTEYLLSNEISGKYGLDISFPSVYDRISISHNQWVAYFPSSFTPEEQKTQYNLNPLFKNVVVGRNTYDISAYINDQIVDNFSFVVHYLNEPESPQEEEIIEENENITPLDIMYFVDWESEYIAEALKNIFSSYNLDDYVSFNRFETPETFEGKIESKDYDIVIRSINMWLRKDISNLLIADAPLINPSMYVNESLALLTNEYFLFSDPARRESIQKQINDIYAQDIPFVILWKEFGTIHIHENLDFSYPFKLYVLGWRKDFVKDLPVFKHIKIDRDAFWNRNNFVSFIKLQDKEDKE